MRDLYTYKEPGPPAGARRARDRLFDVLFFSLEAHLTCFADLGGSLALVATVPSSGGRAGDHPLEEMLRMFGTGFDRVGVEYIGPQGLSRSERRTLSPDWFSVSDDLVVDQHVLLLDDAWVSGAHMQSVASALRAAGARWVSAVPIGRVISPSFGESQAYLSSHPQPPFDPAVCPLTGATHSHRAAGA